MKKFLMQFCPLAAIILMIWKGQAAITYGRASLDLCYLMIIPTLFPFFVCSAMLIRSGFCQVISKLFAPVMRPLFGINPNGSAPFVLGIISGYPLGALTACQMYDSSYLSKTETERILTFCNNSGPLFILGSVGIGLYHDLKIGVLLYAIHILASLTVGFLFRFYKKNSFSPPETCIRMKPQTAGALFSDSLQSSITSILTVCGAVVFFGTLMRIVFDFIPCGETTKSILYGVGEFTTGCFMVSSCDIAMPAKLILTAFIIGFGGISVHMQVTGIVSQHGLSLKPYLLGKILHGGISAVYMYAAVRFVSISAFGQKNTVPTYWNGKVLFFAFAALVLVWTIVVIWDYHKYKHIKAAFTSE